MRAPLREPYAPHAWADVPGTAFASPAGGGELDIDPGDVTQGAVGDCWLAAAMAAVARARPEAIRSAVRANGDNTYDVSLYIGEDGALILQPDPPRTVRVSSHFPVVAGGPAYARPGDTSAEGLRELWPMLIEKGYAAMISGGYPSLSGDVTGVGRVGGLTALLGVGQVETPVAGRTNEQVLADVGGALAAGRPIVCETPAAFTGPAALAEFQQGDVRSNHAYAPVEVTGDTIVLQDPNDHRDRRVPVERFRVLFRAYSIAGDVLRRDPAPGGPVRLAPHGGPPARVE